MRKTIMITGCSSGIGEATALLFFEKGWQVIATMRNPEKRQTRLHHKDLPDLIHLDVTDPTTIQTAIEYTLQKYNRIDALVNNAGYAMYGPFEASSAEQINRQFETNLFGLMKMTQAVLPVFRAQREGVVVNVSSMGGRIGFPLYSVYNSTKWAVEGFSEALQYELRTHHIRIKTVEPGVINTDFYDRSLDKNMEEKISAVYSDILTRAEKSLEQGNLTTGSGCDLVAKVIFRAVTDSSYRLRYRAGFDAAMIGSLRSILPDGIFFKLIERFTLRKS